MPRLMLDCTERGVEGEGEEGEEGEDDLAALLAGVDLG